MGLATLNHLLYEDFFTNPLYRYSPLGGQIPATIRIIFLYLVII
ncbi:hypothetical protein SCACP_12850 [Sporomusa carbonis]